MLEQKVDIPGILIKYIEDSCISYKISIKLVNWVKKIVATDIPGSYAHQRFFKTINQLDSSFDNLTIFKRNFTDHFHQDIKQESSVAPTLAKFHH